MNITITNTGNNNRNRSGILLEGGGGGITQCQSLKWVIQETLKILIAKLKYFLYFQQFIEGEGLQPPIHFRGSAPDKKLLT